MKLLDRLQRRFGRYAVPHATEGLIVCQVLTFLLAMGEPSFVERLELVPRLVLHGEVWRLATFVCSPPLTNPLFALFFWYMFYLMGVALENTWGVFRYNVFLLSGYLATVAVSFLQPNQPASISFLQGSVFLAFAYLFPNFEILLFFILPVKIKWLAAITWITYAYAIIFGDWWVRLYVISSIFNFLLFFSRDLWDRVRTSHRRMSYEAKKLPEANVPRHTCAVCGINSNTHPKAGFRYCSKCDGGLCYCDEHIRNHVHVAKEQE